MDWKLVSAFATGAVLASGIVYLAVKPQDLAKQQQDVVKVPAPRRVPQVPAPPASVAPPTVAHVRPPAPPARVSARMSPVPIREKPSPMPPPVRYERPITVARNDPPPPPPPIVAAPVPRVVEMTPPPVPQLTPPRERVPLENVSLPAPAPTPKVQVRIPNVVTLAAGMTLAVRIGETISSSRNQPGDSFLATLTQPLVIDGFVIAERGARVEGRVETAPVGRGRGPSHLVVSIVRVATSDRQNIRIRTEPYTKDGFSPAALDASKVEIPVETRINFRVQDSVTITERLD
jgi:hypothetical protein